MTNQTSFQKSLGGSPAGIISRFCTLTLVAILMAGGAAAGLAQSQPDAAKPAQKQAVKKTANPDEKTVGGYQVHQSIELGGRIAKVSGSQPMWDTTINQSTGMRVLNQSMEMRTLNAKKTPFFDTLSTFATGFGGDPYDVARLKMSKGKAWDLSGTFRRDRNFFDYNQFANSLDPTPSTPGGAPGSGEVIKQNNTLHLYNTVRRNSDLRLTVMPTSPVSIEFGYNHGTHEGPTLITSRGTVTAQVFQWFRHAADTYTAGVNVKLAPRTALSFDESVIDYKGDAYFTLPNSSLPLYNLAANAMFPVAAPTTPGVASSSGLMATLGPTLVPYTYTAATNTVAPATCGGAAVTGGGVTAPSTLQQEVQNGVMLAFCKAATVDNQSMPIRSLFPTEQIRFSSRYWDKFSFNGRAAYSAGNSQVVNYNWTQEAYTNTRPSYSSSTKTWTPGTDTVGTVYTGTGNHNQYSNSTRAYFNADGGMVAELTKRLSISDTLSYSSFQTTGSLGYQTVTYKVSDPETSLATEPSLFTNFSSAGVVAGAPVATVTSSAPLQAAGLPWWLNQNITSNTALASFIASPMIKVSGGYRFRTRKINYLSNSNLVPTSDMVWHENTGLFGAVIEPTRTIRVNVNYDIMTSGSANTATLSETFTRSQPDKSQHVKVRASVRPSKQVSLFATGNVYLAQNDDPLVNGKQHNQDLSLGASIAPTDTLSFDLSYAYDEVYSVTDSCFGWAATSIPDTFVTPPYGATNINTCSATNSPSPHQGSTSFFYFNNYYKAPSGYYMGVVNYAPVKVFRFNGGVRLNSMHGTADLLNPIQTPGSLDSRTLMPFADAEFKVAQQWAWHGNYTYNGYGEQGSANLVSNGFTSNGLPSRNNHGNVLTLGVKYAF